MHKKLIQKKITNIFFKFCFKISIYKQVKYILRVYYIYINLLTNNFVLLLCLQDKKLMLETKTHNFISNKMRRMNNAIKLYIAYRLKRVQSCKYLF